MEKLGNVGECRHSCFERRLEKVMKAIQEPWFEGCEEPQLEHEETERKNVKLVSGAEGSDLLEA